MAGSGKPSTQKEMLYELWWVVKGSNGDGLLAGFKELARDFKEHKERFDTALQQVWTKGDQAELEKRAAKKKRSTWLVAKDLILIVLAVAGMAGTWIAIFHK